MSSHTPTPWKIGSSNEVFPDGEGGESFSEWLDIRDSEGKVICELPGHSAHMRDSVANKIQDANAAYIVRAVNSHKELLAALKWIAERGWNPFGTTSDNAALSYDCHCIAAQAISKAKGTA